MIKVIIKKEKYDGWLSFKKIEYFEHKFIRYHLCIWYYKMKGYEVEVLENEERRIWKDHKKLK